MMGTFLWTKYLRCPADFPMRDETKSELQEDRMLLFPLHTLVDEMGFAKGKTLVNGEMVQKQIQNEEGWNTVLVRRSKSASRGKSSRRRDGKSYENVVRGNVT